MFEGYGIELEYMIVDKETLDVKPIADDLLRHQLGEIGSDFDNGIVTWSNELVMHVIEIKSTRPESDLEALQRAFSRNIAQINHILEEYDAMLLPSAAHPFMNPFTDTKLWPHDNNEVYDRYDKIFDCRGYGWSNLQSTHLNLPFNNNEDFAKLHAAIRVILPLLPALCASSPILGSAASGMLDTRLKYYKLNQSKIPSITGKVIPEAVFNFEDYKKNIYSIIEKDIAPFNEDGILDPVWVNSRGAIARFDRGSIEIRIMDIQECPAADLAIINLVNETLKLLVSEKLSSFTNQTQADTNLLSTIFDNVIVSGAQTKVEATEFCKLFGISTSCAIQEIWKHILGQIPAQDAYTKKWQSIIHFILERGTLAERILQSTAGDYSQERLLTVYKELSVCLAEDRMFGS
jgi:carboxylate-amine ligase